MNHFNVAHIRNNKVNNLIKLISENNQDNYPELLFAMYFVNIPKGWTFTWNNIKMHLRKETKEKIHFINQEEILETLNVTQNIQHSSFLQKICQVN